MDKILKAIAVKIALLQLTNDPSTTHMVDIQCTINMPRALVEIIGKYCEGLDQEDSSVIFNHTISALAARGFTSELDKLIKLYEKDIKK